MSFPAGNYMIKVNNKDIRTTPTYFFIFSTVSVVNFEQVNAGWVRSSYLQIFQISGSYDFGNSQKLIRES